VLVMTCVVALQALLFQDGGLVVMGANIFNMGILTAVVGYAIFRALLGMLGSRSWGLVVAGFVAALLSVVAAAFLTSLQLIASGSAAPAVVLPAMLGVHLLIGIGEGLITVAALSFLLATRPDLVPAATARLDAPQRRVGRGGIAVAGLGVAAILALLSPLASGAPDGLERVATDLGFLDTSTGPEATSPVGVLPDYTLPGLDGGISTILAGLIGVVIVMSLAYGIATTLNRRRAQSS
jgi:cobalt/nickel transport system permease protein